jgi:hypothetical protein
MTYTLTINGTPIFRPDLISLSVRYNAPRELRFSLAAADAARNNATVVLSVDGAVRFTGRVVSNAPDPQLGHKHVFTAQDRSEESDAVQILRLKRTLAVGGLWAMFYGRYSCPLAELLDEIGAAAADELSARGITSATAVFDGDRGGTVAAMDLHPGGFRSLLERVLDAVPGMRWLYVPSVTAGEPGTFRIVNVFAGEPLTVSVPGSAASLPITRSIEGRYSRVRIEPIVYSSAGYGSIELAPAWNPALEAAWHIGAVSDAINPDGMGNALSDVFRKYSYAGLSASVLTDSPMEIVQLVPRWPGDAGYLPVAVPIGAIDPVNKYIWTRGPAINYYAFRRAAMNAFLPGSAKRAAGMLFRYAYAQEHIATEVEVGPAGTAWSLYGLDRELCVREDSVANVTPERARAILELVSDELVSGSVPVHGAVPSGLWNLGVKLNVATAGRVTGLEQLAAMVTGFTHRFAEGGNTDIEITTDKSAFAAGMTRV